MKARLLAIFIMACLFGGKLQAQTSFSDGQSVSGTWTTYGSPYMINGKVEVQPGASLTIMPGVIVKFSESGSLMVHGSMSAQGSSSSWITFTKNGSGKWKGICFDKTKYGNKMAFCKIEYADYPSFSGVSTYAALTVSESNVDIRNCIVVKNGGVGLQFVSSPNQVVDHCTFADNSNTDLYTSGSTPSNPKVKNSLFWGSPRSIDNTCMAQASYCSLTESSIPTKTTNLGGNIFARDPLFISSSSGDYHLSSSSPCRGAGEGGSEIGAYGYSGGGNVVVNNNVNNGGSGGSRYVPQPQRR